jgi:hypothetical protein
MRPLAQQSARRARGFLPLFAVALVFVFLAPYAVGALSEAGSTVSLTKAVTTEQSSPLLASVTWNGVNVNHYPTVSSAASWSFNNVATVNFTWIGAPVGTGGISEAFVVILFLGFPAYTKQQVESAPLPLGSISMTYNLQQFKWYLQGVYELHAYLENPAGTSLFSEDFYVRVSQPYDLVVATIGLLLLTLAELYLIATVGPRALDKSRKTQSKPPPKTADTGTTPEGGDSAAGGNS